MRLFDWRDLPALHRYRSQSICFSSVLAATRGDGLSSRVLLSYLTPATGIFTWVVPADDQPILGQLEHHAGEPFAKLNFLAPSRALRDPRTQEMLEFMAKQAGQQGAFHILAEVDELEPAYEVLRNAGYGIYTRQRIWKIANPKPVDLAVTWRSVREKDKLFVQTLFQNVVPGLVAQVEPLEIRHLQGLVAYSGPELIGYVDLKYGHRGIWAKPFIHPDVEDIDDHLNSMIAKIPDRRSRPVYLCVRTNQSWLEPALGEMDSQSSPLQAVMVKRLTVHYKIAPARAVPKLDGQTEISPLAHSRQNTIP